MLSLLRSIFTWWNGATFGTVLNTWMNGRFVGEDDFGNRYFEQRKIQTGRKVKRRWVLYKDYAEASAVPPEWHAWLHHIVEEPPTTHPPKRQRWEKEHRANPTGTPQAYRPPGSLSGTGERAPATGDYEAWRPDGASDPTGSLNPRGSSNPKGSSNKGTSGEA